MSVPGDPGRDKTPCHSFRLPLYNRTDPTNRWSAP